MHVFTINSQDPLGKFKTVKESFPHIWQGQVLDVGCRTGEMKQVLGQTDMQQYTGVDFESPANVISNLEFGLPFSNQLFTTSLALDILEHTNDFYGAFAELCRVTKKFVVITLPNCYSFKARIRFVQGKSISGKYGLPTEPVLDRHRWLFSFDDASHFFETVAKQHQFSVVRQGCLVGSGQTRITPSSLIKRYPNLLSPSYIVMLERVN